MSSPDPIATAKLHTLASGKQLYIVTSTPVDVTGVPVLFLHGLGSNTSFYEAPLLSTALAKERMIVRYDFDGHGLSPVSKEDKVTIESLAEDAKGVLDVLGIKKANIVGHSMSGLVVLTFAATYPDLVEKLFLLGPSRALPDQTKQVMKTRASMARTSGLAALVPMIQSTALSKHTLSTSPLSAAMLRALVLPTPPEGYARACEALAQGENPDFSKIRAETLVCAGENDYMCSQVAVDELVASIKGSTSVTMKNCGHWNAIEQPVELAAIFDRFLL